MKRKLTIKFIEGQKPDPSKRLDFRDEWMPGLVLRISTSGTKTFCLHKRINGKMRRLTIGRFPVMSLADARERVRQVLYEIETGRFEDRTGIEVETKRTLGDIIPDYIEKHAKVHNRNWKRKEALLAKFTTLHGKRIDQIKRADVVKACDVIQKSAPTSAKRALVHLKHLMGWCDERGMINHFASKVICCHLRSSSLRSLGRGTEARSSPCMGSVKPESAPAGNLIAKAPASIRFRNCSRKASTAPRATQLKSAARSRSTPMPTSESSFHRAWLCLMLTARRGPKPSRS